MIYTVKKILDNTVVVDCGNKTQVMFVDSLRSLEAAGNTVIWPACDKTRCDESCVCTDCDCDPCMCNDCPAKSDCFTCDDECVREDICNGIDCDCTDCECKGGE